MKKLESEKKQAVSKGNKEASSREQDLDEELQNTKNDVLDKIQALKWADQDKKQMKETISNNEEEIKHLELINAQAKSKYDDLSANYESLANKQQEILKNMTESQKRLHQAKDEMAKKTKAFEKEEQSL